MCNPRSEVANQQQAGNVDNGGEAGQRQGNSFWGIARDIVVRCVIMYFVVSFFTKMQQPKSPSSSSSSSSSSGGPGISHEPSTNLFRNGTLMDLYVFINENPSKVNFDNPGELKWIQKELIFGDWNIGPNQQGFIEFDTDLPLSTRVQNNGTIYLHVYVTKAGHHPNPKDPKYSEFFTIHTSHQLNKYKKRRYSSTHNLLTGQTSASKESIEKVAQNIKEEIISHWHPNLTISVIYDQTPWVQGRVPSPFDQYIKFEPTSGKYFPVIYLNDYWNLQREYQPINTTLKSIPLHLTFQPLSMFKWQLYITQSMKSQWNSILGADMMEESDSSQDSVKEALLETSPILLALTIIVSITHSIFEFLAFKNDIQFWRNRESLEGLSVRSVFFNVFQSVVVFLYVLDNDTNTVVRISIGIGLLIEIWKLPKVTNIQIDYQNKLFNIIPRIKIADKGSYVESSTRQYDTLAFKYLSWVVFPLFVGYAVYSLLYEEHKGWYSWVLGMVYGFLLTFGFISMTPQLFINYKLKSVAHLPWRMLTYKFLNTFIDDIFAFVIKMPTMYRIGCFRDDIIFLIYLYQRWIYRVDLKRVNEFGVSGEVMDKKSNELKDKPMAAIKDKDEDEKEKENVNKPEESKKDQ